jgi:hypothetical protein
VRCSRVQHVGEGPGGAGEPDSDRHGGGPCSHGSQRSRRVGERHEDAADRGRRGGGATPTRWRSSPLPAHHHALDPRLTSRVGPTAASTLRPSPLLHLGRPAQLRLPPPPAR